MRQGRRPIAVIATVNDLHFGETVCGHMEGLDLGEPLRSEPGEDPYPTVMNRAAVAEIVAIDPDLVVAKGDLTASGAGVEWAEFEALYRSAFGDRLLVTPGNHDKPAGGSALPALPEVQAVELAGVTVAVLDTARPGRPGGSLSEEQATWLDDLAGSSRLPVLVFGHHPPGGEDIDRLFGPASAGANALDAEGTARLVEVVARRRSIAGYFAGHTHRNKLRRLGPTGPFPWVEVACVKDFPGSWAEYRVYEDTVEQVHHRISCDPAALRWSERCRALFGGLYPSYAWGDEGDRCFEVPLAGGLRGAPGG